jgi:hypothetical protein
MSSFGFALAPSHPKPNGRRFSTRGLSLWSLLLSFTSDGDGEMLRLEPFPCGPIEHKTIVKPLMLVASSPG